MTAPKPVYFDNAATTPIRDEVVDSMVGAMKNSFGNPSSSHAIGRSSKSIIESCRKSIAKQFNVSAGEIVFTSGGTEADNLVLRSAVRDLNVKHIITSKIEHHAVLHCVEQLQAEYNLEVSFVNIDRHGEVDYNHLEVLLGKPLKTLVSLMHINNEIGNILDLSRVAYLCKANNALFHSDTVQSIGHYRLPLDEIPVDFLVASAHKFHGPKGVGFVYIRKNSGLKPLIFGGEQERGLRAGTESIHNIVGLEIALSLSYKNLDQERDYVKNLKRYFISKITSEIPNITFNGHSSDLERSTYTLVNVCLPVSRSKAAMFLFQLDLKGIACSKGSACQSGSNQNSHVLTELLNDQDLQKPSIRFSFSIYNTKKEVDFVIDTLKKLI
ncbi:cysteine desulfurase family protein [Aestuariivivens sp. NBU2969]|uniref:cysteine desulfurase family protein n=1 Tax=Aestuariivivens sp. NBU2969 TaxID=2873267 RepID=UPI001CBFA5AE|nr:cysteine desulfurase family protein [Aestuariivivens sp. NBU2969]